MNAIPFECSIDVLKTYEEDERWIVEGFAATTDFDLQEDIITDQAIKSSARDLMQNSTVLLNHNTDDSIGRVEKSEARKDGLWLKIFVSKTVPDIWQKIREGVLNKFSIRGKILKAQKQWIEKLKRFARVIFKMQLLEVSLVAVPANPNARALRWYIEKALDDYEAGGGEIEPFNATEHPFTEGDETMDNDNGVIEEELVVAWGDGQNGAGNDNKAAGQETAKSAGGAAGTPDAQQTGDPAQVMALMDGLIAKETDPTRQKVFSHIRAIAEELLASGEPEADNVAKAGRKIASTRLARLKKLLDELQRIVQEVEPAAAEDDKEEKGAKATAKKDEASQKIDTLEKGLADIARQLGLSKAADAKEADQAAPTLMDLVKTLAKRLDTIEGIPAVKTSLDGQEKLAGEQEGGSVWKGLI